MELFGYVFMTEPIILGLLGGILFLLLLDIIQFVKLSGLKKRFSIFMEGPDAKSMEEEIRDRFAQIKDMKKRQEKTEEDVRKIFLNLNRAYQKSAILKYNAFREMGGNLSFVMVFLDKQNSGFLLTSVHSTTNGSYMYSKEIVNGEADVELSKEERETLEKAMNSSEME